MEEADLSYNITVMQTYNAHGKVLLTGEYLILDGAVGIGLPTHHRQTLTIQDITSHTHHILRTAYDPWGVRFEWSYNKSTQQRTHTTDTYISDTLSHLFSYNHYQGNIHHNNQSYHVTTDLSYPRQWWLGSSSTLISLYAQLIQADPYTIHQHQHPNGSGYDIACASAWWPILFQKTPSDPFHITPLDRHPPFADHLYFVYSGSKQDSNHSIATYKTQDKPSPTTLNTITEISTHLMKTNSIEEFRSLIQENESIIASHLHTIPIQQSRFADAPDGLTAKSLGGRGGDFLLIIRSWDQHTLQDYLATKNINTIFTRNEFILS